MILIRISSTFAQQPKEPEKTKSLVLLVFAFQKSFYMLIPVNSACSAGGYNVNYFIGKFNVNKQNFRLIHF